MEKNEAKQLTDSILRRCKNVEAEVLLSGLDESLTRFANNTIHQNVAERNLQVMVRVALGKQIGMATTNRSDETSLDEVVARAKYNASASPVDENFPGFAGPADYAEVTAFDEKTAAYSPLQRAEAVGAVCRRTAEKGLNASGAFSTGCTSETVANSNGAFAHHVTTPVDFKTTVMSEDSSGRAQAYGWRTEDVPVESLGEAAIRKAELGRNPRRIEAGEYPVVFEASVTEDLLLNLDFHGMGAQPVLEGRSWMNGRMGELAMSPLVSIWDDGLDPGGVPMPFDYEGVPRQRVDIVRQGVVQGPVYDRYTAQKAGTISTGHALPSTFRSMGPLAGNLFMAAGESSIEEMIRSTERGVYVSRFWYTRLVHPRDCVVTGMTRDGVFWIENGEIVYPIKNLRFTQSYVEALARVEAVENETHLLSSDYGSFALRVPGLKIASFKFTGVTA